MREKIAMSVCMLLNAPQYLVYASGIETLGTLRRMIINAGLCLAFGAYLMEFHCISDFHSLLYLSRLNPLNLLRNNKTYNSNRRNKIVSFSFTPFLEPR